MKLQELFEQNNEQLNEGMLRNAIAAAGFVLAALPASMMYKPQMVLQKTAVDAVQTTAAKTQPNIEKLVQVAAQRYSVDTKTVQTVVSSAMKHQYSDFPTAKDILAVVGVESSFKPHAVSQLKTDPAKGLMQVRPQTWKLAPDALDTIDGQIKTGSQILRTYYEKLGSREAALHAYNVGIGNHKTGKVKNPRYVPKVDKERNLYSEI